MPSAGQTSPRPGLATLAAQVADLQARNDCLEAQVEALQRMLPHLLAIVQRFRPGAVPLPVPAMPEPTPARERAALLWHMTG